MHFSPHQEGATGGCWDAGDKKWVFKADNYHSCQDMWNFQIMEAKEQKKQQRSRGC